MVPLINNSNKLLLNDIKDYVKIKYFLKKLPIDIIKMIWIEYIKPDLICLKLDSILNSTKSKQLNYYPLYDYIPFVLNNKFVVEYLIKNNQTFNEIYNTHIINNIKLFINFPDILSSMALSWLMYLYH